MDTYTRANFDRELTKKVFSQGDAWGVSPDYSQWSCNEDENRRKGDELDEESLNIAQSICAKENLIYFFNLAKNIFILSKY